MADPDSHPQAGDATPAGSPEKATLIGTLVHLWPYIWPGDRADLKMRVVWSMLLLLAAKLATLTVPFTFKWAIDALNGVGTAPVEPSNWTLWLIASPLLMTASYGAIRVLMAVLTQWRDGIFARVAMVTVVVFMGFTYVATEWRIEIRRKMNDSDTEANTKAIDSLLNYETVKYFSAEQREATRYDHSMERYEHNSVKTYTSLAVLNTGQAIIFTAGLTATMVMCAVGVRNGTNTVGDFVMVNAMMIQLYQPLNFMGMVYREIKQAVIDIEKMFSVLSRNPEIKDVAGAQPLIVTSGTVRFDDVRFSYDPDRQI